MKIFRTENAVVLFLIFIILIGSCQKKDEGSTPAGDKQQISAETAAKMEFVGRRSCEKCHQKQYDLYLGSDHDMAMDVANDTTVLGDFNNAAFTHFGVTSKFYKKDGKFYVYTEGADGNFQEYEVKYTFGIRPLQQYLVEFPGGRYQCLPLCWDTRPKEKGGQRWFHIYGQEHIPPNDMLFWTQVSQNWNYMCAECHSTNLKKNFDYRKERYHTTWSEIDVSCEACHGPGSAHLEWAAAAERGEKPDRFPNLGLAIRLKATDQGTWVFNNMETGTAQRTVARNSTTLIEMCARCHSRRSVISEDYLYGKPFLDTHQPRLLEENLYFPDGQILEEDYVYASFLQSKMYQAGVVCTDCHEPHSGKIYVQGNALCYRCHLAEKYGSRQHHFHNPDSSGASCFECHMPERTYMVVDPRRDHSIRIPRPDLSERIGVPNACNKCHSDKSVQWSIDAMEKWYGPFKDRPKHFGETFWAAQRSYPEAQDELIDLANAKTTSIMVRATALSLLENYPNQKTLPVLRAALGDPDPLLRATAVSSLDILTANDRLPLLLPLLSDSVRLVRTLTARSLSAISKENFTRQDLRLQEEVLREYMQTQYINADNPAAYMNLGVLYLNQGDYIEAEAAYKKAIKIEPYFPLSYINLADLYRMQNRDNEGEQIFKEGLKNNPGAATLHYALGLLYVRKKQTDKAMEHLAKAAETEPENARFAYVYAVALNSTGKSGRAVAELEKALKLNPYDRDLLFALTTIHRDRGEFNKALSYATRLTESFPRDPNYRQLEQQLRYLRDQGE